MLGGLLMSDSTTIDDLRDERPSDLHLTTLEFEAWLRADEEGPNDAAAARGKPPP
jgi:hypothetical protein